MRIVYSCRRIRIMRNRRRRVREEEWLFGVYFHTCSVLVMCWVMRQRNSVETYIPPNRMIIISSTMNEFAMPANAISIYRYG